MKIDVIVTSHARPKLLARCLDSLRGQTRAPDRIILCNDDGDPEVRRVAAEKLRTSDIFLSVPQLRGPAETRNLGIEMTDADWFVFLDDDDSFAPDYLQSAEPHLAACDGFVPFGDYDVVKEDGNGAALKTMRKALSQQDPQSLAVSNFIPIGAFFVPAALRDCRFYTHLGSVEDWDYLLTLAERMPFKHFPFAGSRYHHRPDPTRNGVSKGVIFRDRLVVYSRHPAPTQELRERRLERLKRNQKGLSASVL